MMRRIRNNQHLGIYAGDQILANERVAYSRPSKIWPLVDYIRAASVMFKIRYIQENKNLTDLSSSLHNVLLICQ